MADVIKTEESGWIIDPAILYESQGQSLRHRALKRTGNDHSQSNSTFLPGIAEQIATQPKRGSRVRIVLCTLISGFRCRRDRGCGRKTLRSHRESRFASPAIGGPGPALRTNRLRNSVGRAQARLLSLKERLMRLHSHLEIIGSTRKTKCID